MKSVLFHSTREISDRKIKTVKSVFFLTIYLPTVYSDWWTYTKDRFFRENSHERGNELNDRPTIFLNKK